MSIRWMVNGQALRAEHMTTDHQVNRRGLIARRHQHPVFHLMYILDGEGCFLLNDRETMARKGMLYLIQPGEWHGFSGSEQLPLTNLECTFVLSGEDGQPQPVHLWGGTESGAGEDGQLQLDLKEGESTQTAEESYQQLVREGPIAVPPHLEPVLLEGYRRLLNPVRSYLSKEHQSLMVMELLLRTEEVLRRIYQAQHGEGMAEGAGAGAGSGARMTELLQQYMSSRLGQQMTLEELAGFVHLSPNYLCRVFKEHSGLTPMAYLQQLRMIEAEKLLLYTDLPVYTISEMVGYEDSSYFARVFRRYHSRSPSSYRII
ncbi:AraC family transcriptional regulator [Paenibacillus sp. GCM10023252]|uniref:AraC family transcriptional regulator n=1 Tax=Paenibacillus sp. GCM10023252 TaxID=3252649 RepID=UPI00361E006A